MTGTKKLVCILVGFVVAPGVVRAQRAEESTVEAASAVLREITAIPAKAIPMKLLADANGVVIIPDMIKGGFVVGVRRGKGVMVARNASGEWTAPVFVTVTGGSVGLQAGLQETDVVAVFRNRQSVDRLMRGKLTIGADAAVAAGPVGRDASAATDAQLKAEILSYSRSRGLFAGVAIDGALIHVDHRAMAAYYAPVPGQPNDAVPASAIKLVEQIAAYAEPRRKVINVKEAPAIAAPDDVETVRVQLVESSLRLHKLVDSRWAQYLALPGEVYEAGKAPAKDAFATCLDHFRVISKDARYQELTARAEFQETYALLFRYRSALEGSKSDALRLPAPPK